MRSGRDSCRIVRESTIGGRRVRVLCAVAIVASICLLTVLPLAQVALAASPSPSSTHRSSPFQLSHSPSSSPADRSPTALASQPRLQPSPLTSNPPNDEIFTGVGDLQGWHVFTASSRDDWTWHNLANLQPAAWNQERWIGQQCLTGDGRWVIAVIAPWHTVNTSAGMNGGGLAYAIDSQSGFVRALASGVSLAYFNPGCGIGDIVALTSYPAKVQTPTRLSAIDVTTGRVLGSTTVPGEVTSAVPVGGTIMAAQGSHLVVIRGQSLSDAGELSGQPFDLRANARGGLDFMVSGGASAYAYQWSAGRSSKLGSASLDSVRLIPGAGGHNLLWGSRDLPATSPIRPLELPLGTRPDITSLDGSAALVSRKASTAPQVGGNVDRATTLVETSTGRSFDRTLPEPTATASAAMPQTSLAALASTKGPGSSSSANGALSPLINTTSPTCAVPRNDLWNQVAQPNSSQIDWATQQAVRGWLVGGNIPARIPQAQNYKIADSTALGSYFPNTDFPPPAISGNSGVSVPPQVLYGILAQESNWNQASWHALAGYGGNPLIANYYGSTNPMSPSDINYDNADCGYGLGQLTDIMKVGAPGVTQAQQVAVAVDYTENVAAATQALITKWNQLASLGDVMNNNDGRMIENWYGAIWAYNSGVHLGDPGYGLGWRNNPANPIYNPSRPHFLRTTYNDANHPQDWPYQELVFGWIESAQIDPNTGGYRYVGVSQPGPSLNIPPVMTFCSQTVNSCNPNAVYPADPCPSENSSCWWDRSASWVNCSSGCISETFVISSPTQPEPAATGRNGYCSSGNGMPGGSVPSSAILVDDTALTAQNPQSLDPNVIGCPTTPSGWQSSGAFELDNSGGTAIGVSDVAAIDLHQLGTGFGGHTWFTHTRSDAAMEVIAKWSPTISTNGFYDIRVWVPTPGATTTTATYQIVGHAGAIPWTYTLNQNSYGNQWVSLGKYALQSGAVLKLASVTSAPDGGDMAFSAAAFLPASADSNIWIDPSTGYAFKGWGTSLAWWANALGSWSAAGRQTVETQLFAPPPSYGSVRLGLNVIRYNIGASPTGSMPSGCPQTLRDGAQMPSVKQSATGPITLANDQNQINILLDANSIITGAAAIPYYEAFANSPPFWMTVSGCPTGNSGPLMADNLSSQNYQAYADYLAAVVQQFRLSYNITFATVAPFNEPSDFNWPGNGQPQEGANFSPATQNAVMGNLCAEAGLGGTVASAMDENHIDGTINDFRSYTNKSCLHQLNTHGYDGFGTNPYSGTSRGTLHTLAASNADRLWMSEFTMAPTGGDLVSGINLSQQIAADLQYLRPEAWIYWQAVEEPGGYGLLNTTANFGTESTTTNTGRYWALAQYSQFIRPGFLIDTAHNPALDDSHEASGTLVYTVAAKDPVSGKITIVTTNPGAGQAAISYDLSRFGFTSISQIQTYRTSSSGWVTQAPDPATNGTSFMDTQPAQSITSYVITPRTGAAPIHIAAPASKSSPTGMANSATWEPAQGHLTLDGKSLIVDESCTRTGTMNCLDGTGRQPEASVVCNLLGLAATPTVEVRLTGTEELIFSGATVAWSQGRQDVVTAQGVIRRSSTLLAVDAILGGHHLVGSIGCT